MKNFLRRKRNIKSSDWISEINLDWDIRMQALYHYWVNCNDIWNLVFVQCKNNLRISITEEVVEDAYFWARVNRLSIAYALLYVVIEGYKKLKINDERIDFLLSENDFLNKLRLFRNACFHFHNKPLPRKIRDFFMLKDTADWALNIRWAFEKYFRKHLPIDELMKKCKIPEKRREK